jgi:signal transduction histidine kinase
MSLRTKLALLFALFAAVPLALALWPVAGALSEALAAEHGARAEAAVRVLEGELARRGAEASLAVAALARSEAVLAVARDRAPGDAPSPDDAARAAEWMAAADLDVLALADAEGRILSSGHLPGRAGDVDAELAALVAGSAPGEPAPRLLARARDEGLETVVALASWSPVPGEGASLLLAGGVVLDRAEADRLAALTGGTVAVLSPDGAPLVAASPAEGGAPPRPQSRLAGRLGGLGEVARTVRLGPPERPVATVEVRLGAAGLARARLTVLATFLAALALGTLAAAAVGSLLASRVTRPLDALRGAAARVAAGDLAARVETGATGEVGELVDAFNAMTADLARSRSRLAQAERIAAWREVARRLAHEIKNPLTPIAMSVETLRDAHAAGRSDFGEIFDEATRAVGEEVRRLKRIVDEFSRFARLPAPERAAVAPEELVGSVLALFPAPPPEVELVRALEPGLPPVLADREQILQLLLNLLQNAFDALPGGGRVVVSARREGGEVAIAVADSGRGIAPEDLARVFEPYFTTKEGGTGLGLAIAERIAEEHGGALAVESAPGDGTTFTLRLPVAGAAEATGPASP